MSAGAAAWSMRTTLMSEGLSHDAYMSYLEEDPKQRKLYVIQARDDSRRINNCKIGISKNPESRFRDIQRTSCIELKLFSVLDRTRLFRLSPALIERDMKKMYATRRAHSHSYEWFECDAYWLDNKVRDYVFQLRNKVFQSIGKQFGELKYNCPKPDSVTRLRPHVRGRFWSEPGKPCCKYCENSEFSALVDGCWIKYCQQLRT